MLEREIVREVVLATPDGCVNRDALGWSRHVVHDCSLPGPWGRRKRWHYWCVTSPTHILSLTIVDLDFAAAAIAVAVDRVQQRTVRQVALAPPARRRSMPDRADSGTVELAGRRLRLRFEDRTSEVELTLRSPRIAADLRVQRPEAREALGVALAWDDRHFAYTCKDPGLSADGAIAIDGDAQPMVGAFACLDWGRGVWPSRTAWNWASAAGRVGGRTIALNLGARWTDGRGVNENALFIDGRSRKIASDVRFDFDRARPSRPWTITGPDVDLTVTPETLQSTPGPLRVIGTSLALAFGRMQGRVLDVDVGELFGWCEEFHTRW